MAPILDSPTRRALRARAHHLDPVVTIGHHGLTPSVLHEVEVALRAHELIKIRVFVDDRATREGMLETLAAAVHAAPVQHLGKLLVLWRPDPDKEAALRAKSGTARGGRKPAGVDDPRKRGEAAKGGRGSGQKIRAGASGHGARKRGSSAAEEAAIARKRRRDAAAGKAPGDAPRDGGTKAPPARGRARPALAEPGDASGPFVARQRPAPPTGVPRAVQPRRRRART